MLNFSSITRRSNRQIILAVALTVFLGACGQKISRDDFATAVKGKNTKEVQAAMGKPDSVDESKPGTIRWTYESRTFSTGEAATKRDNRTIVVFQQRDPASAPTVADVLFD